jgi:DNA processing protein
MAAVSTESTAAQYWLALTRVDGLGTRSVHKLVEHFGAPESVYSAPAADLEGAGLAPAVARRIMAGAGLAEAERELGQAEKLGCTVVPYGAAFYPEQLKQITDPPPALYVRGDPALLALHAVAVVGTRRPTAYGSSVAHRLASDLAQRRITIVSGLARGVDSAAHRGALEANGRTVAVFGCGVDVIYPRDNKRLAERIVEQGALVSEFPLGTSPQPENFPIRNRIISGLTLGVVVVEAAEYSGSLITARLATEQNREVYAVPGNITSAQSFGPNLLIKQGAKLVDNWMDVVEEFPANVRAQLMPPAAASEKRGMAEAPQLEFGLEGDLKAVYDTLRPDQAMFVDAIFDAVRLPQPRVLSALLELEMGGWVRQLPGKNFVRKL